MTTKKIIFSMLLSTLASNTANAMENTKEIIHLSPVVVSSFTQKNEHPFLIIDDIKHFAYPDPRHNTYKSDPIFFSRTFMHSLNLNVEWRRQNGRPEYETTHYHKELIKSLQTLRQQV